MNMSVGFRPQIAPKRNYGVSNAQRKAVGFGCKYEEMGRQLKKELEEAKKAGNKSRIKNLEYELMQWEKGNQTSPQGRLPDNLVDFLKPR